MQYIKVQVHNVFRASDCDIVLTCQARLDLISHIYLHSADNTAVQFVAVQAAFEMLIVQLDFIITISLQCVVQRSSHMYVNK